MPFSDLPARHWRASCWPWLLLAGAFLASCHHKEKLPDPCEGQVANPLTIQFIEGFGTPTPDTAYNNQPMVFRAPGAPYTSYEWLFGSIDKRTGQNVIVDFSKNDLGTIPVRLIARRPLNTVCFPHDDGVDTLTKILTLVPFRDLHAPIYGKFQGANKDAPADTFSVRVYSGPDLKYVNNPDYVNYLVGIPKGCRIPYQEIGLTWRGLFASSGGCTSFNVNKGYLTTRDSIRLEYRAQVLPTIIDRVFLGKRVR